MRDAIVRKVLSPVGHPLRNEISLDPRQGQPHLPSGLFLSAEQLILGGDCLENAANTKFAEVEFCQLRQSRVLGSSHHSIMRSPVPMRQIILGKVWKVHRAQHAQETDKTCRTYYGPSQG